LRVYILDILSLSYACEMLTFFKGI